MWIRSADTGCSPDPYGIRTTGGDVGNASVFATSLGELTVDNGLEFTREHAIAEQFATPVSGSEGWMTYGPSGVRLMTSAFSKASLKATDWLTLSAGARYDHFNSEGEGYLAKFPERSGSRVSPNAGIVLTPLDGIQLYGQYTEGYRPPSLRESHWHYEGLLVNNPDLRPEIARNYEVGLNILRKDVALTGDKLRFKLSYFDNHYNDYIIRMNALGFGGQNKYQWYNIDGANYRGFEISGGYDVGSFFFEGAFTKYTAIEYCPTVDTCGPPSALGRNLAGSPTSPLQNDYATNYIPPEYAGSLTVGVRLFDQALTLGARTHFSATRLGSVWPGAGGGQVGYQFTWPEYRIFDIFGSYKLTNDTLLNLSVENVTNEYYFGALSSAGIPSPGRTARIGLTATLGDSKFPVPDLTLGRASEGAPGSNWTGLYLGGHLGHGFADIAGTTTAANGAVGGISATESADLSLRDLTKGFQAGFSYQFTNGLVVGIEGDHSWLKHTGTQEAAVTESATLGAAGVLQAKTTYELDWMATLRGRVGYAFDRMLVYGTGGLAFLKETEERVQYRSDQGSVTLPAGRSTAEFFREGASATRRGWAVGGGWEYALTNNWSLKGEYLYAHFGEEDFLFPDARAGVTQPYSYRCSPRPCSPFTIRVPGSSETANGRKAANELELHTIRIGVNYRF